MNTKQSLSIEEIILKNESASRSSRLSAYLIDTLVVFIPLLIIISILMINGMTFNNIESQIHTVSIIYSIIIYTIQIILLSRQGQTIGKYFLKIKIVKIDTCENGGFVTNVLLRIIVNYFLNIIPFYGLADILSIFRSDNRCFHDLIAGTKVIDASFDKKIYLTDINIKKETVNKIENNAWKRYFARSIDLGIIGLIADITSNLFNFNNIFIIILLANTTWVLFEAIIISLFGNTLGKLILNIKISDIEKKKISFKKALKRSIKVWIYGSGFSLPILNIFFYIKSYNSLIKNKITKWDKEENIEVSYKELDNSRIILTIFIMIIIFILNSMLSLNISNT